MRIALDLSLTAKAGVGGGNPAFRQDGPTLDLVFAGAVTDPLRAPSEEDQGLILDFARGGYQVAAQYARWGNSGLEALDFADIVTFSRTGSTATFFNSAGVLTTAAADVPRFDYDPSTLALRGLLIEEQRTNSIRNNTMQGAVAGTPGTLPTNWAASTVLTGLTRTIATGTENGIAYIDVRLNGTPSAAGRYDIFYETSTQVAALNGQTWTNSGYFKLQAGTLSGVTAVRLYFEEKNSSGTYLTEQNITITSPTSAALGTQRASGTRTLNQATTAFLLSGFNLLLDGTAIDITLRIGLPQLEQGAFATSVIPTTTTALTRNADTANINTLAPWYNQVSGTVYAEFMNMVAGSATQTNGAQGVWGITQSALTGSFNGYALSTNLTAPNTASLNFRSRYQPTGKNDSVNVGGGYLAATTTYKTAAAWDSSQITADSGVGVLSTGTNNAAADMGTHDRMQLGSQNGGGGLPYQLNGWLRRITYFPRRLSSADLQTITT